MKTRLKKLDLNGWKSIRALSDFELRSMNVIVGANGAGKSNFLSFFKLLNAMATAPGNLQYLVAKSGGADALLHHGSAITRDLYSRLSLATDDGKIDYEMLLYPGAPDTLGFLDEKYRFLPNGEFGQVDWTLESFGNRESRLIAEAESGDKSAGTVVELLKNTIVHQFHNTSETARARKNWNIDDNYALKEDAANLAAFLLRLRIDHPKYYALIENTIRLIVPFFGGFELTPRNNSVILQWRERHGDMIFGPHQASDGTLRAMALVALLLQPEQDLPSILIIDEPELGLHPFAINIMAGLIKAASVHTQVIIATQSTTMIDYFEMEDLIVVDRKEDEANDFLSESQFSRPDPEQLKDWLEDYSLSELWEKNVIGGRPT